MHSRCFLDTLYLMSCWTLSRWLFPLLSHPNSLLPSSVFSASKIHLEYTPHPSFSVPCHTLVKTPIYLGGLQTGFSAQHLPCAHPYATAAQDCYFDLKTEWHHSFTSPCSSGEPRSLSCDGKPPCLGPFPLWAHSCADFFRFTKLAPSLGFEWAHAHTSNH